MSEKENSEVKTCLICKSSGDLSTEEIPYWSKKKGNYSPYPKMITCDAKYALEDRDKMVEETPPIKDKAIELKMNFGEGSSEKWVFYFAANEQNDMLEINSPGEAYGEDENKGLVKTDKDGKVVLKLNCPQPYRAEGTTYCRHVHYLLEEDGVWLPMRTTRVICEIELEKLDKVLKDKTALVINALDFKDYDKDKIPGSVNLPFSDLEKLGIEEKEKRVMDFIKENIEKLKPISDKVKEDKLDIKDVPIITYCAKKQCKASENLLDQLYECGVNNVLEFSGGMELWNKERTFFGGDSEDEVEDKDEVEDEVESEENNSDSDSVKESSSESDSDEDLDSSSDSSSDSEDEEESEDGGIDVKHEGVKYLYDKKNKELCNLEADVVATADYKDGKLTNIKWKKGEKENHESSPDYKKEKSDEEKSDEEKSDEEESEITHDKEDEEDEEDENKDKEDEEPVEESVEEPEIESFKESEEESEEESAEEESEEENAEVESEEEDKESSENKRFEYTEDELRVKTVPKLKELVINMTKRKGGSYSFPLGKKGYRTKGQIIELIKTCQGKPSKKCQFEYIDEDDLYSMRLSELKEHVQNMISREEGSYKFALSNFRKNDLIELLLACQGDPIQKGGIEIKKKYKGYGWGFMF